MFSRLLPLVSIIQVFNDHIAVELYETRFLELEHLNIILPLLFDQKSTHRLTELQPMNWPLCIDDFLDRRSKL